MKVLGSTLQLLLCSGFISWAWLATGYHATGASLWGWRAAIVAVAIAMASGLLWGRSTLVWAGCAAILLPGAIWWFSSAPRADRIWAADVAHGVTAQVEGDIVTLDNVRNFDWQTDEIAIENWETRQVDLSTITSTDMIMSVWDSPAIAHTLVSFGFADGQYLAFSAEIRREQGEAFSALGGFFKQYELVMIAADERDIVRLRTDKRGEQVSLFPIGLPAELRRDLFLSFINEANALEAEPKWYHTLLANCTTVPFTLVKAISPGLGLDWRVVASGYLPNYLHEIGVLRPDLSLSEVWLRGRLQASSLAPSGQELSGPAYSASIREVWKD